MVIMNIVHPFTLEEITARERERSEVRRRETAMKRERELKDWNPNNPESSHRRVEEDEDLRLYAFKYWLPYFPTPERPC
jgi:hypothetical protein